MELTWCIALLMIVANTQRADKQVGRSRGPRVSEINVVLAADRLTVSLSLQEIEIHA